MLEQRRLDRAREDVDAADHEHVVDAAREARDPRVSAPAWALAGQELRHVARPVADHRQRLLRQGRQHELSEPLGGLARIRIDYLGQEVVVEDVQAALRLPALHRDPGADHLGEAVDVTGVEVAPRLLDLLPQALGPRLGAENAVLELDFSAGFGRALREQVAEGRCTADPAGAEVGQELDLEGGVAARRGDGGRPEPLHAVVEPQPSGEEPIAVGDVNDVLRRRAGAADRAGVDVSENLDVGARVGDDRRLVPRPGGGVDPDRLLERHRQQPVRVAVEVLLLGCEGELRERVIRRNVGELLRPVALDTVERFDQLREPAPLLLGARLDRHRLELGLEDHFGVGSLPELTKRRSCGIRMLPRRIALRHSRWNAFGGAMNFIVEPVIRRFSTAAGRRSRSYASRSPEAIALATAVASSTPEFMPRAPNGAIRCAASPARKTRPTRKRLASLEWKR